VLKDNRMILQDLETKLKNLVDCIIAKAATDSEFAIQLENILLNLNELSVTDTPINQIKEITKNRKDKKQNFNPVDYLHNNGEKLLRDKLNLLTDNELKQTLRASSSGKIRIPKIVERQKLIEDTVTVSTRTLKQGSSFL
jgi:hypothetical protein